MGTRGRVIFNENALDLGDRNEKKNSPNGEIFVKSGKFIALTDNLQVALLTSHWIGVYLAHVPSSIRFLYVSYV